MASKELTESLLLRQKEIKKSNKNRARKFSRPIFITY